MLRGACLVPAVEFLGARVLLILVPSSLVPVATQAMAEHRLYLPLAAICLGPSWLSPGC